MRTPRQLAAYTSAGRISCRLSLRSHESAASTGGPRPGEYTTRADLARVGSFLLMGLIGIVIASLVNMFLLSSTLQLAISIIGVIVFVGLTAYDTQRIKEIYLGSDTLVITGKEADHMYADALS